MRRHWHAGPAVPRIPVHDHLSPRGDVVLMEGPSFPSHSRFRTFLHHLVSLGPQIFFELRSFVARTLYILDQSKKFKFQKDLVF